MRKHAVDAVNHAGWEVQELTEHGWIITEPSHVQYSTRIEAEIDCDTLNIVFMGREFRVYESLFTK